MMNNNKNTETRAQQLTALIEFAKSNGYDGNIDKLVKVLEQWTKPHSKSNTPSKAAVENANLAAAVMQVMPQGEAVTGQWIGEHTPNFPVGSKGFPTPQKITAVMSLLIDAGKVSKVKVGKTMTYTLI